MRPWDWIALVTALVLGFSLARFGGAFVRRFRVRRRISRAARGELKAAELAERSGYRVVETQAHAEVTVSVDGEEHTADVYADLLLERAGRRYVGEVKTGRTAPDPMHGATRRQLFEYSAAFECDAVLLFDMEAREIREVRFPIERVQRTAWGRGLLIASALVLAGAILEARLGWARALLAR